MKTIKIFGLAMVMLVSVQLLNARAIHPMATLQQPAPPPPPPPPPKPHKLHKPPFHAHLKWRHHHVNLHLPPHPKTPPPPPPPPAHP